MENREMATGLRTVADAHELLCSDITGDEAWIKLKGFRLPKSDAIPDDVPLSRISYLGPFYIYDFD